MVNEGNTHEFSPLNLNYFLSSSWQKNQTGGWEEEVYYRKNVKEEWAFRNLMEGEEWAFRDLMVGEEWVFKDLTGPEVWAWVLMDSAGWVFQEQMVGVLMIKEMEELKKHRRFENNEEKGEMESPATEEEETQVEKIETESSRERSEYLTLTRKFLVQVHERKLRNTECKYIAWKIAETLHYLIIREPHISIVHRWFHFLSFEIKQFEETKNI